MGLIPSHDEHAPSELLGEDPYKEFDAPEPPAKSDLTCAVCGEQTKLNCPCGTVAYCSKACQKSDWREGHKKVCKARREGHKKEAADAAASAPAFGHYIQTPEDKYDDLEKHRYGDQCPICFDNWVDIDPPPGVPRTVLQSCCCRATCHRCSLKIRGKPCPLCRKPWPKTHAMMLAYLRQNVDNGVSEAMNQLGDFYRFGRVVAAPNPNKAAKLYTRAIELGNLDAMNNLGFMHSQGSSARRIRTWPWSSGSPPRTAATRARRATWAASSSGARRRGSTTARPSRT